MDSEPTGWLGIGTLALLEIMLDIDNDEEIKGVVTSTDLLETILGERHQQG